MSATYEEALHLAQICLTDPHNTGHTLELMSWNGVCRRRLNRQPEPVYDALYRLAVTRTGVQALHALHTVHLGFLSMNQPDRALDVLRYVETCATGRPDERWIRGRLDARRAIAVGDVEGLMQAARQLEVGSGSDPAKLYTAWTLMVEALHSSGALDQARELTHKMMRLSDTHSPGRMGGFDVLTLATIEITAQDFHRARGLVDAARTRSKDRGLLRVCAHADIVLAIGVDPSVIPDALQFIESVPTSIPDPGEIRLLEHALSLDPDLPGVRALLARHRTATEAHHANARAILNLSPADARL